VVISWDWCGVVRVWVMSVPFGLHEGVSLGDTSLPTSTRRVFLCRLFSSALDVSTYVTVFSWDCSELATFISHASSNESYVSVQPSFPAPRVTSLVIRCRLLYIHVIMRYYTSLRASLQLLSVIARVVRPTTQYSFHTSTHDLKVRARHTAVTVCRRWRRTPPPQSATTNRLAATNGSNSSSRKSKPLRLRRLRIFTSPVLPKTTTSNWKRWSKTTQSTSKRSRSSSLSLSRAQSRREKTERPRKTTLLSSNPSSHSLPRAARRRQKTE
jgi:hypothetical protein